MKSGEPSATEAGKTWPPKQPVKLWATLTERPSELPVNSTLAASTIKNIASKALKATYCRNYHVNLTTSLLMPVVQLRTWIAVRSSPQWQNATARTATTPETANQTTKPVIPKNRFWASYHSRILTSLTAQHYLTSFCSPETQAASMQLIAHLAAETMARSFTVTASMTKHRPSVNPRSMRAFRTTGEALSRSKQALRTKFSLSQSTATSDQSRKNGARRHSP